MKPRPRIRKTIKWGGGAASLLLIAVWFTSGWVIAGYTSSQTDTYIAGGTWFLAHPKHPEDGMAPYLWGWRCGVVRRLEPGVQRWRWTTSFTDRPILLMLEVPLLWIVPIPACIGLAAWRLDVLARRGARLNLCPKCGYDRAGIAGDAKCPECGSVPT